MPGHPLRIGVDGGLGHDVKPGLELLLTAQPDLDPGRHDSVGFVGEGTAEHVLERFEPVTSRLHPFDAPGQGGIAEQGRPPGAHKRSPYGCSLRRHEAPSAAFPRKDMGVPALRGHFFSLIAHDHPGPPGSHRGRAAKANGTFLGIPRHLSEPQLP